MLISNLKDSFDGMRGENKFLRLALFVLVISNLAVSCTALQKDEIVTLVPPTLQEKSWVSKTQSDSQYSESWALYIAMLLGNVTPANAVVVKEALGPLMSPDLYQSAMGVLDKQIHQIRQDRVTMSFEPQKVLRDTVNPNRFFVTGRSVSEGPAGDKKRTNRTFEIELRIKDYKPQLTWISTNTGDARTQDVIDREEKQEARKVERAAEKG